MGSNSRGLVLVGGGCLRRRRIWLPEVQIPLFIGHLRGQLTID
jgi:hypothetical protein